MKSFIKLIIFFTSINLSKAQKNLSSLEWNIEPVFSRDGQGNLYSQKVFVDLNFKLSGKTNDIIVFNYEEIYKSLENKSGCFRESQTFWKYLDDSLKMSHLFIENQDSIVISLYENIINPSYVFDVYPITTKKKFDYSIFQLSDNIILNERLRYPIPVISLDVCKKSSKFRLIYFQYPNDHMKKMGVKKMILVSEWFNVNEIK